MKKIARIFFALTFLVTTGSANALPMLVGSGSSGGSAYDVYQYMSGDDKSWSIAAAFAIGQGGYLASIFDATENTDITNLVQGTSISQGQVWAGGYQTGPGAANANWAWINGEAWSYTNWADLEPNDFNGPEEHLGINWTSGGEWNDEGNLGNIVGFVVEKAIPEPSVIALFGLGLLGLGFARRIRR